MTAPNWALDRARTVYNEAREEVERDQHQPGAVVGPSNFQRIIADAIAAAHREGFEAGRDGAADVAEALGQHSGTNAQPAIASIVRELRVISYPDPVEKEGSDG